MASNRVIDFNLKGAGGAAMNSSGGFVQICSAGTPDKLALVDRDGAAMSNPAAFTRGGIYAEVAKANTTVDCYILAPTGHMVVIKGMIPGDRQMVSVPTNDFRTTLVIPFSITDSVAATEKDTGFDLPTDGVVLPDGIGIEVITVDAAISIEAGILSSESGGDADGLIDAASTAVAGFIPADVTVTTGVLAASPTIGALVCDFTVGTNADDRGIANKKTYKCNGTAKSISYTLLVAADTAKGFLIIPLELGGVRSLQAFAS